LRFVILNVFTTGINAVSFFARF